MIQKNVKPKLTPVQVNWKVASSTPFLKLTVPEFEQKTLEFVAKFISDEGEYSERLVSIVFKQAGWFRITPARSDGTVIDDKIYDFDESIPRLRFPEDVKDWMQKFRDQWIISKTCPDPGMYEVSNSDWLLSTGAINLGYKHFLVRGEEMFVEILSVDWSWEAGEIIDWAKNDD